MGSLLLSLSCAPRCCDHTSVQCALVSLLSCCKNEIYWSDFRSPTLDFKNLLLAQQSALFYIKITRDHILVSKPDADAALDGLWTQTFWILSLSKKRPTGRTQFAAEKKLSALSKRKKQNKSASVLHRVCSIRETTLQKPNFPKRPNLRSNLWNCPKGSSGRISGGECFPSFFLLQLIPDGNGPI